MKSLTRAFIFCLGSLAFLVGCKDSEPVKVDACLPTQFPLEEDAGEAITSYDSKNRIINITYTFDDEPNVFRSAHLYKDGKASFIYFYVNGYLADDFVAIKYGVDTVRENYYRTRELPEYLRSYRKYYLKDEKISGFTEFELSDNFARGDSTIIEYTGENVTMMKIFNSDDILVTTIELEFDDKVNPYFETGFSGGEYLYSFLNLSVNNPIKQTNVELGETIEYTYTYDERGFPLTRESTLTMTSGDFIYSCSE
jgi:hypothetical protein